MEGEIILPNSVPDNRPQVYGEGDTYLVQHLLPDNVANDAFKRIKEEVHWETMHHHG